MTSSPKKSRAIMLVVIALAGVMLSKVAHKIHKPQDNAPPTPTSQTPSAAADQPHELKLVDASPAPKARKPSWESIRVRPRDNLKRLLTAQHVNPTEVTALLKLADKRLLQLRHGTTIRLQRDADGKLLALAVPVGNTQELMVTKYRHGFQRKLINLPIETHHEYAAGTVRSTLASASKNAGLTPAMYNELLRMFEGRINFAQDIRHGDRFAVLYETQSVNGKKIVPKGKVVAAKVMTRQQTYYAVRFGYPSHPESYFTPTGNSVESRFLPYPLRFKRISSHFTYHRFDPVLHSVRPHLGVDFAADSGTPIKAVGDGRITFIGKENGYGNSVRVSFGNHYSALYAHMHHFAKNIHLNQYIHKGDTIGYVGSTGWATGPHLHFSFYENGKPKNWLAMGHTTGEPIPKRYWGSFKAKAHSLLAKLDVGGNTHLAANSDDLKHIR